MREKQANAGNKRKTGKVGKENHQNVASFSQRKDARRGNDVAFRNQRGHFQTHSGGHYQTQHLRIHFDCQGQGHHFAPQEAEGHFQTHGKGHFQTFSRQEQQFNDVYNVFLC